MLFPRESQSGSRSVRRTMEDLSVYQYPNRLDRERRDYNDGGGGGGGGGVGGEGRKCMGGMGCRAGQGREKRARS